MNTTTALIPHEFNDVTILQRKKDGYLNATASCKACKKDFYDYKRLETTQKFLQALSRRSGIPVTGIPVTETEFPKDRSVQICTDPPEGHRDIPVTPLLDIVKTGPNESRGTWVHPYVAVNMGQWANPDFAAQVSIWVYDWMYTGQTPDVNAGVQHLVEKIALLERENAALREISGLKDEKIARLEAKPGKRRWLKPAEVQQIVELKAANCTVRQIAEQLDRPPETIRTVLSRERKRNASR